MSGRHKKKVCKVCGKAKQMSARCFYRHNTLDGWRKECKECWIAYVKENRDLKYEYYRSVQKSYDASPEAAAKRAKYRATERGRKVVSEVNARYYRLKKFFKAEGARA